MTPYAARLVIRRPEAATAKVGTFEARWVEAEGQTSDPFELKPPLSAEDAADLRWYLERYHEFVGAGTQARAARIEAKLDPWGHALYKAAFGTTEGTHVYRNLLEAEEDDRPVLLTLGTAEPDVLVQPWELMRDREGPLAFRGVSIRRQLEGAKRYKRLELRLPLRLLLIVSRPRDSGFIDPRTSVRPLLDGLDRLPRGAVEIEFCEPPTLGELEERISQARREKRPFHIVHFDGHGTYLHKTGVGALCFEKEDRKKDLVIGRRLGDLLFRLKVPLVILEACRTSDLSDQPVFGSVAPASLESGVGSVVACPQPGAGRGSGRSGSTGGGCPECRDPASDPRRADRGPCRARGVAASGRRVDRGEPGNRARAKQPGRRSSVVFSTRSPSAKARRSR